MFKDIFNLTYFEKYLKHKKFKIPLPLFGGRAMEMRERKGRGEERSAVPPETSYMDTQRGFPLSVCQTTANTGTARAMPATKGAFAYLFREHSVVEETGFKYK